MSIYEAEARNKTAEKIHKELDNILKSASKPKTFCYADLMDNKPFPVSEPTMPDIVVPEMPQEPNYPSAPDRDNPKYNTKPSFFEKLSKKKTDALKIADEGNYNYDVREWEREVEQLKKAYSDQLVRYEKKLEEQKEQVDAFKERHRKWIEERDKYLKRQEKQNDKVNVLEYRVKEGDKRSLEKLFSYYLSYIELPFSFVIKGFAEYDPETKQLAVECYLPTIESIPRVKNVTYIRSRNTIKESYYSESYIKKKYESVIYQIVMAVINYCLNSEEGKQFVDFVTINGRVKTIDAATGQKIEPCVLSVGTSREDFDRVILNAVDPKAWFKNSKGVSGTSLSKVTPVPPLIKLEKNDKRIVDAYEVAEGMDVGENLAAMDWQDFENLIRELFEKEFISTGGEVKITQASRDGGVDALVYDPDPIRGGKIVIQAKRYTNTVGVSAIRDLYGTVLNEGANKGIIVTTSNYGNDAYEFAKDKPLTLMNGANLLYLLEKHGHQARIDIKEAKDMLKA